MKELYVLKQEISFFFAFFFFKVYITNVPMQKDVGLWM